jgi:hypothetical protein
MGPRFPAFKRKRLARNPGHSALSYSAAATAISLNHGHAGGDQFTARNQSESVSSSSFEASVALAIREYSNIPAPVEFPKR